jgi:hypothetical protein
MAADYPTSVWYVETDPAQGSRDPVHLRASTNVIKNYVTKIVRDNFLPGDTDSEMPQ